jgi:hypothetical protein
VIANAANPQPIRQNKSIRRFKAFIAMHSCFSGARHGMSFVTLDFETASLI